MQPNTSASVKKPRPAKAVEPVPTPEPVVEIVATRAPTVAGQVVSELAVLVQPAAFLVTQDGGTHEITRCYWQHGKYSVGSYSNARVGQFTVIHAELDGDLTLHFTGGYQVRVPSHRLQSTHRV